MSINSSTKKSKCKPAPTTPTSNQTKTPRTASTQISHKTHESVEKASSSQCSTPHNKWLFPPILNSSASSNPSKWFATLITSSTSRTKKSKPSNCTKSKSSNPKTKCYTRVQRPLTRSRSKLKKLRMRLSKRKFRISLSYKNCNRKRMARREILYPRLKRKICLSPMWKYSSRSSKMKKPTKTIKNTWLMTKKIKEMENKTYKDILIIVNWTMTLKNPFSSASKPTAFPT